MKQSNFLKRATHFDESRSAIPSEHLFALGMGLAAWWLTRRHFSFIARSIGLGVGAALITRAANGRDGVSKIARMLPFGRSVQGQNERLKTAKYS